MSVWDTSFINNLPDSSFAYVEPGEKDSGGKTVPRSKRHLPYKGSDDKVDLPHLRNALARLDQTQISPEAKAKAKAKLDAAAGMAGVGKSDSGEFEMFIPITKIDTGQRIVIGRITDETVDKSGEAFDYATSKPHYMEWSNDISKATDGKSVGNLRAMHTAKVAGKLVELRFDDEAKSIECVAKVLDDSEWNLCLEGAYTGLSQGGRYKNRWTDDGGVKRYTVAPSEVSLVDNPCLSSARFELVKADGTTEEKEFKAHGSTVDGKTQDEIKNDPPEPEPIPDPKTAVSVSDYQREYEVKKAELLQLHKYIKKER